MKIIDSREMINFDLRDANKIEMSIFSKKEEKYISLKEAADISGYSADYVGQLIRKGKLTGKQVYTQISWVTTESAIKGYVDESRKSKAESSVLDFSIKERFVAFKNSLTNEAELAKLYKLLLYIVIIVSLSISLGIFYVFSVSLDRSLERDTLKRYVVEATTTQN